MQIMAISSIYAGKLERELEIVKAERDELQKHYETLIMEKDELSKNYTQIGENLSYYIGLSDRYYHEGEELRKYIQELEDTLGLRNQS